MYNNKTPKVHIAVSYFYICRFAGNDIRCYLDEVFVDIENGNAERLPEVSYGYR